MKLKTNQHCWLFAFLGMPGGLNGGMIALLGPYLLRAYHVPVDRIAEILTIGNIPSVLHFVYTPLVDLGLRRRTWIILTTILAATLAALAMISIPYSLPAVTGFLFGSSVVGYLISSANGALLGTLPENVRGRASGWYQAGVLCGRGLGGGIAVWLAGYMSLPFLAAADAIVVVLPATIAFLIDEASPVRGAIGSKFLNLFRDVHELVHSRRTLLGLIFLLAPLSGAAVGNLISGLAVDYHAPATEVMFVTGMVSGLLKALGSFVGGFVADRINRMAAYAIGGLSASAFAAYLGFGPTTPLTYGLGYAGYAVSIGFSYAVLTALILDVIGNRQHAVATVYSILTGAASLPSLYMTWLDGLGYKYGAVKGLMSVDAAANAAGGFVLLGIAFMARNYWKRDTTLAASTVG